MRIAITLGDPAGIGPEVALKAVSMLPKRFRRNIILLGPASFYSELTRKLKLNLKFKHFEDQAVISSVARNPLEEISRPFGPRDDSSTEIAAPRPPKSMADPRLPAGRQARNDRGGSPLSQDDGRIVCLFDGNFPKKIIHSRSIRSQTVAVVRSIELAVNLAIARGIDAIVTPPINKAGLKKAGFDIPGHTEFLAKLSGTKHFEMMLVGGNLKVVLVTRHTPIKEVPIKITRKRVEEAILLTDQELRKSFGIKRPRLVVCGLNPHAGEQGTIGREEIKEIAPAVRNAKKKTNAIIVGPFSPDVLFHDAYLGRYDAEICMYHDQGLIPLKMISRGSGVNVTLGLPFVRTSPDHGTGYDIAKKFIADPGSMIEALRLACVLSKNRKKYVAASK